MDPVICHVFRGLTVLFVGGFPGRLLKRSHLFLTVQVDLFPDAADGEIKADTIPFFIEMNFVGKAPDDEKPTALEPGCGKGWFGRIGYLSERKSLAFVLNVKDKLTRLCLKKDVNHFPLIHLVAVDETVLNGFHHCSGDVAIIVHPYVIPVANFFKKPFHQVKVFHA